MAFGQQKTEIPTFARFWKSGNPLDTKLGGGATFPIPPQELCFTKKSQYGGGLWIPCFPNNKKIILRVYPSVVDGIPSNDDDDDETLYITNPVGGMYIQSVVVVFSYPGFLIFFHI